MENFNFAQLGIHEMDAVEMLNVDGGYIGDFISFWMWFGGMYMEFAQENVEMAEVGANCM
jgi:hypothetical protein